MSLNKKKNIEKKKKLISTINRIIMSSNKQKIWKKKT